MDRSPRRLKWTGVTARDEVRLDRIRRAVMGVEGKQVNVVV